MMEGWMGKYSPLDVYTKLRCSESEDTWWPGGEQQPAGEEQVGQRPQTLCNKDDVRLQSGLRLLYQAPTGVQQHIVSRGPRLSEGPPTHSESQ